MWYRGIQAGHDPQRRTGTDLSLAFVARTGFLVFTIPLPDKCHRTPTCSLLVIWRMPVVIWCLKLCIPNQSFFLVCAVKNTDGENHGRKKPIKYSLPIPAFPRLRSSPHGPSNAIEVGPELCLRWDMSRAFSDTCGNLGKIGRAFFRASFVSTLPGMLSLLKEKCVASLTFRLVLPA